MVPSQPGHLEDGSSGWGLSGEQGSIQGSSSFFHPPFQTLLAQARRHKRSDPVVHSWRSCDPRPVISPLKFPDPHLPVRTYLGSPGEELDRLGRMGTRETLNTPSHLQFPDCRERC